MTSSENDLLAAIVEDLGSQSFDETTITQLRALADERLELIKERDNLESLKKDVERRIRVIEEETLVSVMDEMGIALFELDDGVQFKLDEALHMSIPEKNKDRCAKWLVDHHYSELVERDVSMRFGTGETERLQKLFADLNKAGWSDHYQIKRNMNTARVKALFRELLEKGEVLPLKLFGGYLRRYVKIKTK